MTKVIEYSNAFSHGPVGLEYPFPTDIASFPDWYLQFTHRDLSEIKSMVATGWESTNRCVRSIVDCLSNFSPRSLYYLPNEFDSTKHWLLFENKRLVLFIPEPSKTLQVEGLDPDLSEIITTFGGYRFGYNHHASENFLREDSGFVQKSEIRTIKKSDESYQWESDESVIGGVWFFTTPCGNRFYCRIDGTIAKWDIGSSVIETIFDSSQQFADSFAEFHGSNEFDRNSPFLY